MPYGKALVRNGMSKIYLCPYCKAEMTKHLVNCGGADCKKKHNANVTGTATSGCLSPVHVLFENGQPCDYWVYPATREEADCVLRKSLQKTLTAQSTPGIL